MPAAMRLGMFEDFTDEPLVSEGMAAVGGSRSSKASKKKEEDEESNFTTVMLRNIPNKYTRQMLIDQLHRAGFVGDIDYLYLPTDFANRCNVGYCFVNFRTSSARARFCSVFDSVAAQSCLPGFNSYKVCQVTRAKWQGREENVRRLRSGPELMAQLAAHPDWLPLLLDESGNKEPFLCEEVATARFLGPGPRRSVRRRNPGPMYATLAQPMPEGWVMGPEMAEMYNGGAYDALGEDDFGTAGLGPRRRRSGRGQQSAGFDDQAGTYGGVPFPLSMPVLTDQGLQYVPYDPYQGGGYLVAYPAMGPDHQIYGMPYGAPYGHDYQWWAGADGAGFDPHTAVGSWPRSGRQGARSKRRTNNTSHSSSDIWTVDASTQQGS